MKQVKTYTKSDYRNAIKPTWCKGCSYYSVLSSLTGVFARRQLDPLNTNVISGIGCSSRLPLYLGTFGMHTLHGRAIPVAIGAKLSRPDTTVIVVGGDGDLFSIGTGHFVHAARKNFNITVLCLDNRMYAMTKNQASPTSAVGFKGSLTPQGKISIPLNVIEFAIACEASFVSRTYAGSPQHMEQIINQAIAHNGFSFVEIIAPCTTFEHQDHKDFFKKRITDINDQYNHDTSSKAEAQKRAAQAFAYDLDINATIPVGIFWKNVSGATFETQADAIRESSQKYQVRDLLTKFRVE